MTAMTIKILGSLERDLRLFTPPVHSWLSFSDVMSGVRRPREANFYFSFTPLLSPPSCLLLLPLQSLLRGKRKDGRKKGREAKLRPSIPRGIFINWLAGWAWLRLYFYFPSTFPIELVFKWANKYRTCSLKFDSTFTHRGR